jgi:hypothetical protein
MSTHRSMVMLLALQAAACANSPQSQTLSGLRGDVDVLQADVEDLQAEVEGLQPTDLTAVLAEIELLKERVLTLEVQYEACREDLDDLEVRFNGLDVAQTDLTLLVDHVSEEVLGATPIAPGAPGFEEQWGETVVDAHGQGLMSLEGELADAQTLLDDLHGEVVSQPVAVGQAGYEGQWAGSRIDDASGPGLDCPDCVRFADLDPYAQKTWVSEQGYLTDAALAPYARTTYVDAGDQVDRSWVSQQGYLTDAALEPYALRSYCDAGDQADRVWMAEQGYLTDDVLEAYALTTYVDAGDQGDRDWVSQQGYLTGVALVPYALMSYVDAGDQADRDWVSQQGYLAEAALEPYALKTYVDGGDDAVTDWVLAQGYATEAWVLDQEYAGRSDLDQLSARAVTVYDPSAFVGHGPEIEVPGEVADVQEALDYLANYRLVEDVEILVQNDHCGHIYDRSIVVDHVDGGHIFIRSEPGASAACSLGFEGSAFAATHGVVVSRGRTLGGIEGLHLDCANAMCGHGLLAEGASDVNLDDVWISRFPGNGIYMSGGATVSATGLRLTDNLENGVLALTGAVLEAPGSTATGNGIAGFNVQQGAVLSVRSSSATGNGVGFYGIDGAVIHAPDSTASGNLGHPGTEGNGVTVGNQSFCEFSRSVIDSNNEFGVHARGNSTVMLEHATMSNNAQDGVLLDAASVAWAWGGDSNGSRGGHGWAIKDGSHLSAKTTGGEQPSASGNLGSGFYVSEGSSASMNYAQSHNNVGAGITFVDGSVGEISNSYSYQNNHVGIWISHGSGVRGDNVLAEDNGADGFLVSTGSTFAGAGGTARNNGDDGVRADNGGVCYVSGFTSSGNAGSGFASFYGATMIASDSTSSENIAGSGYISYSGSYIYASHATSERNGSVGAAAEDDSFIDLRHGEISGNAGPSISTTIGSMVDADGSVLSGVPANLPISSDVTLLSGIFKN